ncbi:MAG: hypothetical protein U5K69_04755 [Balneolaceae bacterium]|nr:hypothetical protein [Balneolaceae bacterium]
MEKARGKLAFGALVFYVLVRDGIYMPHLPSEILTRVPDSPFLNMVGLATGLIMSIGGIYFYYRENRLAGYFYSTELADKDSLK